jgi:hypothetical protein
MNFKMPKSVYQIIMGVFMLSFVAVACNSKGDKKDATKDTIQKKPVDPGTAPSAPNEPVDPGTKPTGDTVKKKPVDPGT